MKCYGCGKPGHIAKDCRSKNMVKRPQLNILERIPIKTTGPPEDRLETEYEDEELDEIMNDLLALVNPLLNNNIKELVAKEDGLRKEIAKKQRNIGRIEQRLTDIHEQLKELGSNDKSDDSQARKEMPEQGQDREGSEWEYLSTTSGEGEESRLSEKRAKSCASTSKDPQTQLEKNTEFYQEKVLDGLLQKEFRNDSQHPQHGVMHWTACANATCPVHWEAKSNLGKAIRIRTCGKTWTSCHDLSCNWHLATKRKRKWFPNHDQRWHSSLHGHLKYDEHTVECHLIEWYACFHDKCEKHMRQKRITGFLPESGKE